MIFGILREIAVRARILDRLDDGRAPFDLPPTKLIVELAVALGQHRYLLGTRHCSKPSYQNPCPKTMAWRACQPACQRQIVCGSLALGGGIIGLERGDFK